MGSVTRSIKRFFASDDPIATRLQRVFTPCLGGDGTKNINIRIFDEHALVNDMATPDEVKSDLKNFLHSLPTQSGVEPAVAGQLSPISFNVTYARTAPSKADINQFGVSDFPIYLLTATGSFRSSADDVVSLLVNHRIPELTFVGRRQDANALVLSHVRAYQTLEDDWAEKPDILGFGIPALIFCLTAKPSVARSGSLRCRDP